MMTPYIYYNRSDEVPESSSNEENANLMTQPSSPPVGDVASCAINDGEPDNTAVKPKLSVATDEFFVIDSLIKKPAVGMNHLMERFVNILPQCLIISVPN